MSSAPSSSRWEVKENTSGHKTLCFYEYGGCWCCERKACVSAGAGLDLGKLSTKSAWDCSKSSIRTGHFWKMRSEKCARDCSESSVSPKKKRKKTKGRRVALDLRGKVHTVDTAPAMVAAPAMQACNGLRENALAGLRAGKREWCYYSPAVRDCSCRLLNALQELRERWSLNIVPPRLRYAGALARRTVLAGEFGCRSYTRAETGQRRSTGSPYKKLLREDVYSWQEVPQRRSHSVKK